MCEDFLNALILVAGVAVGAAACRFGFGTGEDFFDLSLSFIIPRLPGRAAGGPVFFRRRGW